MYKSFMALMLVLVFVLTGCSSNTEPAASTGISRDTLDSIRQYISDNISSEYEVDGITAIDSDGKVSISAQLHGGISGIDFEPFAKEVVLAAMTAIEDNGLELVEIHVNTKNAAGEMISWLTRDGENGTLADTRNGAKNVMPNVQVDEIGEKLAS